VAWLAWLISEFSWSSWVSLNHKGARRAPHAMVMVAYYGVVRKL
jgi:hypothetical protein